MKHNFFVLLFLLTFSFAFQHSIAQDSLNMTKLGHLPYPVQLSNIWGYATEGKEYALVGTFLGTSIVDVTDPANPTEVFFKSGPHSVWREIKVYNDHLYISTEAGGGIQIVDLTPLPQNTNLSSVNYTGSLYPFTTSHTLTIDENGILYIFGSDYSEGGALMYDLNVDPSSPVELGVFDEYYIHDGFVRGDTLWASCINDGFLAIIDVSDKANPVVETTFNTPNNFTHNSWPNGNNHFLFTTDEVSNSYVTSYDVSDLDNIAELDRFQHNAGSNSIAHNTHFLNNYLFTSYYTDGVVVIDASDPYNLVEAGFYDTSPNFSGNGFNGCWGVYPYLPSGNIVASDMNSGLWVLGFNSARACYLEGTVTDFDNNNPLTGVAIEILTTTGITSTGLTGEYSTGFANAGTYSVQFSKNGYIPQTINNVVLTNGNTTILDVQLIPDVPYILNGQVVEESTGNAIANAFVKIHNSGFSQDVTTDVNGMFNIAQFYSGIYEIDAGKWNYTTECNDFTLSSVSGTTVIELAKGIYDDFSFNFGWTETNTSPSGQWERDVPAGTDFDGDPSNPDLDVNNDCLNMAFVTGNDGGDAGDDDVDDGNAILTSPVFDISTYTEPYINYSRWFFNGGGNGSDPNDTLKIELSNGQQTVLLENISATSGAMSVWLERSFKISDYLTPSSAMTLKITATDYSPGHLVEGGLDKFFISEGFNIGIAEREFANMNIYPNPSGGIFSVEYILPADCKQAFITLIDITGRVVYNTAILSPSGKISLDEHLNPGIYFVNLQDDKNAIVTKKVIKY